MKYISILLNSKLCRWVPCISERERAFVADRVEKTQDSSQGLENMLGFK